MKYFLFTFLLFFYFKFYSQDSIIVSIAHGSKPKRQYKDEFKTIGGMKGGHVVIILDDFAYGFYFTGRRIHIFPHRKRKNGTFQKQTQKEWENVTKEKKVTNFYIPITTQQKSDILSFYNKNLINPKYDYAFFGQRCASSVYNVLKTNNLTGRGGYFFNAFYLGKLRKTLLEQAKKKQYRIIVKSGSSKRKWEGD